MEAERTGDVLLGSTHEDRFGPFINGQPSERNPLFCRRMIWGDFVYTTAEGFREGSVSAQAERERERGEGGSQQSPFSLRWVSLLFSFCLALFCQSKSPQIVLLCAGAFPQGYVVHGHLSAPASPALPLQDHLMNSSKMRHTEVFLHRNRNIKYEH